MTASAASIEETTVVPFSNDGSRAAADTRRYRMRVSNSMSDAPSVQIEDRKLGKTALEWRGPAARKLIDTLPDTSGDGIYPVHKSLMLKLALLGAAAAMQQRETNADGSRRDLVDAQLALAARLDELRIDIPAELRCVATQMFRYPGRHLCEDDVVGITTLCQPLMEEQRIRMVLDKLVADGVVQRIGVNGMSFYDLDTTPHLHVFDPSTKELVDAPETGVLQLQA